MRQIIKLDAADKVNIKLMKCGGIYPAIKLAHQAEMAALNAKLDPWSNHPLPLPQDSMSLSRKIITSVELTGPLKFTKDIGNLHYDVPFIRLNEKPGLGIEINEDTLQELTVFQDVVR